MNYPDAVFPEQPYLHQTLHGYSDGHHLLASSMSLSESLDRLMLRMSDLSGNSVASGFEEYITGYPLVPGQLYALAKTWYAPEMSRPGCVWTHTLIVPKAAMALIPTLAALQSLFRRPKSQAGRDVFTKSISLEDILASLEGVPRAAEPDRALATLLALYYGPGDTPVLLAARDSAEYLDTILDLWSQQWPALRMGLSFCTGSLSARFLGARPFDIQCVPHSIVRDVRLEVSATGAAKPFVLDEAVCDVPTWAKDAAADARCVRGGAIREFLWAAAGESNGRAEFSSLLTTFMAVEQDMSVAELMSFVARAFPNREDGSRLKVLLFGSPTVRRLLPGRDEATMLSAIAASCDYSGFDGEILRIRSRAAELCLQRPDVTVDLLRELFARPLNPLGEEILVGAISELTPDLALKVADGQPWLLPALCKAKPMLAAAPELWRAAGGRRRELFESVAAQDPLEDRLVHAVTCAILEGGADSLIGRSLDTWGKPATFAVLDWMSHHEGAMPDSCRGALSFRVQQAMDWLEAAPERPALAVVALARVIAPHVRQVSRRDTGVWLRALGELRRLPGKSSDLLFCSAFLLALALENAPPAPLTLVSECFEVVHKATWDSALPDGAWEILEPLVPHLWWPNDWDRCERLRRGLVQAFVWYQWPRSLLLECTEDRDLRERLEHSAPKVAGWY